MHVAPRARAAANVRRAKHAREDLDHARADALAKRARREKIDRCIKFPVALPFLLLLALLRDLTWFCLILRSIDFYVTINVDRRFEELFFGFKDSLIALGARFAHGRRARSFGW